MWVFPGKFVSSFWYVTFLLPVFCLRKRTVPVIEEADVPQVDSEPQRWKKNTSMGKYTNLRLAMWEGLFFVDSFFWAKSWWIPNQGVRIRVKTTEDIFGQAQFLWWKQRCDFWDDSPTEAATVLRRPVVTSAHEFQKLKDAIKTPWEVMCFVADYPCVAWFFFYRTLPFSEADDEAPEMVLRSPSVWHWL